MKAISRIGDFLPKQELHLYNRTGATLNPGDVIAIDLTGSDQSATYAQYLASYQSNPEKNPLANAIAVASGNDDGWLYAVAQETIADDGVGRFLLKGLTLVKVVGSSAVVNGARLKPTAGQVYLSAEGDGLAIVGVALGDGATDSDVDKVWTIFDGWAIAGPQAEV
jgi:hypothetical protein